MGRGAQSLAADGAVILAVFLGCVFMSVPIGLSVVAYSLAVGTVNMGYIASGLFASCGIGKIPFADLVKKIIPFLLALLIGLILITYCEPIVLAVPHLLGYKS